MDVLALAIAAEFRLVDAPGAIAILDGFGEQLARAASTTNRAPAELAIACGQLLGVEHGFSGDRERYDDPSNSMLDVVLSQRRGLPILLSVIYIEVARRAGIALAGVGFPGHFVVGHFGVDPPALIDPFNGGVRLEPPISQGLIRRWRPWEIAWRILNNLVASYERRGDLTSAIRAAQMRLTLPAEGSPRDTMHAELRALRARLN